MRLSKQFFYFAMVAVFSVVLLSSSNALAAGPNLVLNPDFETAGPANWAKGGWGTNTATLTYPVAGQTGNAAKAQITKYTNGDAKWYFTDVAVTPNTAYTFSDAYNSSVASSLVIRYTSTSNALSYVQIAALPSSSNAWTTTTNTFTTPSNAKSMTMFHLIQAVGQLTIDNVLVTGGSTVVTPPPVVPPADTTAPTVSISSPANNATVSGTSVVLNASATDATGVVGVQFLVDNVNFGTEDTASPYSTTLNSTTLLNGTHTLSAKARDAAGNSATASVSVTVSNTTTTPPAPTPPPTTNPNLVLNPDFETAGPANWAKGGWGTNTATLTYPVAGQTGNAAKAQITKYTNGDAKWYFSDVVVTPSTAYTFSDSYNSNIASSLVIRYTSTSNALSYVQIATLPSSGNAWATTTNTFTTPSNAKSMTMFHLIQAVGQLTIDNVSVTGGSTTPPPVVPPSGNPDLFSKGIVSLTFDDGWTDQYTNGIPILNAANMKGSFYIITNEIGDTPLYMTASQVLAIQAAGHEIGAHTKTHPDLTTLSAAAAQIEIAGSRSALLALGATPVSTFVYPYGEYNASLQTIVKNAGFIAARSVIDDEGANTKSTDKFALKVQNILPTTTVAQVKGWIDQANADHAWLILVFHQINNQATSGNPEFDYATTPTVLQGIVSYLQTTNTSVMTMKDVIPLMNP